MENAELLKLRVSFYLLIPHLDYNNAMDLMGEGDYIEAIEAFEELK